MLSLVEHCINAYSQCNKCSVRERVSLYIFSFLDAERLKLGLLRKIVLHAVRPAA